MKRVFLICLLIFCCFISISQNSSANMKNLLSEYNYVTNYIQIDTLDIAYVKEGNGAKTLLFVHGLSSNADAWSKNIEGLSAYYTCIAIDLPGYGKSSKIKTNYTPEFFAEVLHKFIDKMNLNNTILIGHSMGGQAAIKHSVLYPDEIKQLVLIAPAGFERFTEIESNLIKGAVLPEIIKNTTEEQIERNYLINFYKMPEDANKMMLDRKSIRNSSDFEEHCIAISSSVSGMLDMPVYDDLDKIALKTLVIFGENDMLIPNRYLHPQMTIQGIAESAKNELQNGQVEFVKESGHFVQYEKPHEVNSIILRFLQ